MKAARTSRLLAAGAREIPADITKEALAKDNQLFLTLASTAMKWELPTGPVNSIGAPYFVGTKGPGLPRKSSGGPQWEGRHVAGPNAADGGTPSLPDDVPAALDTAVLAGHGFSAEKDLRAQLLALNQQVAAKIENGEPVTAPGESKSYPDAKELMTEDCIRPLIRASASATST